jgi:tetratricopeptide (TPR) repeat protein
MAAIPKPYRVAFLVPEVKVEGPDGAHEHEARVLLWTACIETCQRHPRLAVLDAEATPLFPQDGHFAPAHAGHGARATDTFYGPTRRDEVLWLELILSSRPTAVRLHAVTRDGKQETFDALGPRVGEQIQQVLAAWLTARGLGQLPRPFERVTTDDVLATLRVVAPTLAEQARAWTLPAASGPTWTLRLVEDEVIEDEPETEAHASDDDVIERAIESTIDSTLDLDPAQVKSAEQGREPRRSLVRPLVNRLPAPFKVPALRLLELALREDLHEAIRAVDPAHPQALLAGISADAPDPAVLRAAIASAPGWARSYELLGDGGLEAVAAAGMAMLCRPASLHALETLGDRLVADDRADEALRIVERGVELHMDDPSAHLALLDVHEHTDRPGAWLAQAIRSANLHGCPMDPVFPWYPDQIHVDLRAATALLDVGRLDEAIALRANRLEGREATWPYHTRVLASWRKDPRFVAWSHAREGYFRGDEARAVEGFGRVEPGDDVDLAIFLDSLVALGREDEVALAWAQFGLGRRHDGPIARLAAARGLLAAGDWRRGVEELWRAELTGPGRDDHVAIARCGLLLASAPLEILEEALGERVAVGAPTLARVLARTIADFVPAAAKSSVVTRALAQTQPLDFDPAWLSGFGAELRGRRAIDALFDELGPLRKGPPAGTFDVADELQRASRLVNRWLEVAFADASEDDHAALAQAAAYLAAQALARYLAATTLPPSPICGALRYVASGALALARCHARALDDRLARAVLGAVEPTLRRIDRWLASTWLGALERSLRIDERSGGDVAGFARDFPTVAARILGPEETAVLSWSVARLHRERPDGWAAKVSVQAARLAMHTGNTGADEFADAIVAQLAARELELDDAIDALHTASYLAEGASAGPSVHAARVLLEAGRAPAAFAVLCAGLPAAAPARRDAAIAALGEPWKKSHIDVPIEFARTAAAMFEALQAGDAVRAEKLGRWAVAYDPGNGEAHRNLGLALAMQGKVNEALVHLVRATPEQATQILAGVLYQHGKLPEAIAVLDYASRWYVRAEQWLTYAGIAYAATDSARTVKAYALGYALDPDAFDASQLNAYAGVLDEVGDHATCEHIANHLLRVAGTDRMWLTSGWNHLACAYIGLGKFDEAIALAERAIADNPLPDNTPAFATTLERARSRTRAMPPPPPPASPASRATRPREPVYAMLEAGDMRSAAAQQSARSWRVRRAALHAARFRFASENHVAVTPRARAAALAVLADTTTTVDREAVQARALALLIREQAYFARDPLPPLGDRMTRDAFYAEFRARGGVVLGTDTSPPPPFVDREVLPGAKIARASDYVALLRDLAALAPHDALAQFGLDDASYLDEATQWAAALAKDPELARTISAGLRK